MGLLAHFRLFKRVEMRSEDLRDILKVLVGFGAEQSLLDKVSHFLS